MNPIKLSLRLSEPFREVRLARPQGNQALAEEEVLQREQAAFERGRREGEKALGEQLMRQRTELVELQNGVMTALREAVPQVVRDTEATVVELALEVAQKLVAGIPISAEMVTAAVQEAVSQVEENTDFHIYLHPDDLEMLRRIDSDLLQSRPGEQPTFFHPAPEVTRGGCLVRTRFGVVDGRRETKLELLKNSLAA